jgi:hypothetical protein
MALKAVRALDHLPKICAAAALRRRIRPDDVRLMRDFCPRQLKLTIGEVEALFSLARENHAACPEWNDYFADAMGHWFVETFAPDHPPAEAAEALIDWLGGAGARLDAARLRLLSRVLETLPHCPESLMTFARLCLVRAMARDAEDEAAAGVA